MTMLDARRALEAGVVTLAGPFMGEVSALVEGRIILR